MKIPIILLAIILLGAVLRLYGLTAKPLWYDETGFIAHALKDPGFMLHSVANYKIPYIVLLKIWTGIFGIGAFPARILSVLLGIASIFLVYLLGRNLFNREVGLIAAFLLSISCFHIYHSQQVKQYSFLVFLAILSFIYFIDFWERKKAGALIANLLLNVLIVFTHPFGLFIILVQFLYVICIHRIIDKKQLKNWFYFQLPLMLFLGLWAWVLGAEKDNFKSILWWLRPPNVQSLMDTFTTFCYGGPAYGLSTVDSTSFPPLIALAMMQVFGTFFMRGLFLIFSPQAKMRQTFVVIWLAVPIALSFLFSHLFFPIYLIKDLLIFLPAFYLIVARGIYYKRRLFSYAILTVIFLLNIIPLRTMYGANINVDWQKAVHFIKNNDLKSNDIIIMATTKEVVSFMYYLSDADKAALNNVLIFGEFEDGRWQESFQYKDYYIITLGSERAQGKDAYRDPGFGINKVYNPAYIAVDFDRKVMKEDVLNSNRQIWLLISKWAGDVYCSQTMSDKLGAHFKLTLAEEAGGIKIYRFRPGL